jgi:hypothetical protein
MTLAVGLGAGLAGLVLGLLTPASASTATSTTFGNVGPTSAVPATTYDPNLGGLLVGGHSIDALVADSTTAAALTTLQANGIQPVTKALALDLGGLISTLDGGRTIVVSNDSDFGISGLTGTTPPFTLTAKILPNGQQDDGEFLEITR